MINFLKDENGSGAVEYGLLLSLIFLVLVGAVKLFSEAVNDKLFTLAANLFP